MAVLLLAFIDKATLGVGAIQQSELIVGGSSTAGTLSTPILTTDIEARGPIFSCGMFTRAVFFCALFARAVFACAVFACAVFACAMFACAVLACAGLFAVFARTVLACAVRRALIAQASIAQADTVRRGAARADRLLCVTAICVRNDSVN